MLQQLSLNLPTIILNGRVLKTWAGMCTDSRHGGYGNEISQKQVGCQSALGEEDALIQLSLIEDTTAAR